MKNKTGIALLQTAATACLWGTSFPVVTIGLKGGLDPRAFAFLRFAAAVPVMLLAAKMTRKNVRALLSTKEVWIIGSLNAAGFLCQFVGQQYTDASVAALLVNLSVVMAAAGGVMFLGERFGFTKGLGIVLAVVGTSLLATNGSLASISEGQLLGYVLYLAAAVAWAAYIVYTKKKSDQLGWDPIALSAGVVTATAVILLPVAATAGIPPAVNSTSLWVIGYTAIVNTAVPYVLYQQGLRYLTASTSSVVLTLEIVVAVGLSVGFLGEVLSLLGWIGAGTVLISILLVSGVEVRRKPRRVSPSREPPGGMSLAP